MKSGGSYKFKYATLDHLIEHVRKPLTDNGIWFIQLTEPGRMVTRLIHESGESVDSAVPMPNLPSAPQEAGSILSYFRRYSLAVALGLASDEDDDANIAEGNGYEATQRGRENDAAPEKEGAGMPDAEFSKLASLLKATGVPASKLIKEYKVQNLRLLNQDQYGDAIERLNNRLAVMAKEESNTRVSQPAEQPADEFVEVSADDCPF